MMNFLLVWMPIIAALIMPILLRAKKTWIAFFIILLTYLVFSFGAVVVTAMSNMMVDGQSDPTLVSGQIAERFVSSVLTSVIVIPLALLLFVGWRKLTRKAENGSESV